MSLEQVAAQTPLARYVLFGTDPARAVARTRCPLRLKGGKPGGGGSRDGFWLPPAAPGADADCARESEPEPILERHQSSSALEVPDASALIKERNQTVRVQDEYDLGEVLGEGGFAQVRRATHKITGQQVAIKSIDLCKIKPDKLDMLKNEIEVMKMLDHPSIVRLYETFQDPEHHKLHLAMELCEGGDLLDFLVKCDVKDDGSKWWSGESSTGSVMSHCLTEHQIAQLAGKMLSALHYLHSRSIAHRDIKPENFLLEARAGDEHGSPFAGGEIKMIDFGFSKIFHGTEEMHQMMGSPYYVAPEILLADQRRKQLLARSDDKTPVGYGPTRIYGYAYALVHVCVYVCTHVCMYVYTYVCICI